MIYFLNKGLILEQEIVTALQQYFNSLGIDKMFENYTLNITNEHPFALLLNTSGETNALSLFPAIVVTSESDNHNQKIGQLLEMANLILEPADVDQLIDYGYMIEPEMVERIRGEFAERQKLYGITHITRRSERMSLQLWADNMRLKNELYEMTRLFILGGLHEMLEPFARKNNLAIFDESVTGQRSGTYSDFYGITLAGANIVFDAEYLIEQSIIDTDLVDENIDIMEVINHVKEQAGTSRSVVFDCPGDGAPPG
jgi:hypothetical protein